MHDNPRLNLVQQMLEKTGHQAVLIRSTDRYFNEYVPYHQSPRAIITGFDGSAGDALISLKSAHLFVDGRYGLQARNQAVGFNIHVCTNSQSIENSWLASLAEILSPQAKLAYDPSTIDMALYERLEQEAKIAQLMLAPTAQDIIGTGFNQQQHEQKTAKLWAIPPELHGSSTEEKIKVLSQACQQLGVAGLLVVKLDDIAWLLNMRSDYFPLQLSVPGLLALINKQIFLGLPEGLDVDQVNINNLIITKEHELIQRIKSELGEQSSIGIDKLATSQAHLMGLLKADISVKNISNPIAGLKARKNEKELLHLRYAFKKADQVVYQTQNFVIDSYEKGEPLSEAQVDDYVKKQFASSGAQALSFRPICAGAQNGAIIHYGTPNHQEKVKSGSLFLLDTGAYYQGGLATDLTRTFLAAPKKTPALAWQKELFTLVLLASIRGLSARFKRGTLGMQLDAIVREPLWQRGLDFAHGTGHGVGINVHEFPPRIGPTSSTPLMEGQVFSIEPGLYYEGLGGVRIENLATIVADPSNDLFLRVLPLTFCPLDQSLVNNNMLSSYDQEFLNYYEQQWLSSADWPDLPPSPKLDRHLVL